MTEFSKRDPAGVPQEVKDLMYNKLFGDGKTREPSSLEHILTAETMGVVPGAPDPWCSHVLKLIQEKSFAEAGLEIAKLVDYALKTQHDDHFNREVRNCVHLFWNRCVDEIRKTTDAQI